MLLKSLLVTFVGSQAGPAYSQKFLFPKKRESRRGQKTKKPEVPMVRYAKAVVPGNMPK